MNHEVLGLRKYQQLKRQNVKPILFFSLWTALLGVWIFLVFFFQNRNTYLLWIILGSFITFLFLVVLLFAFTKIGRPLWDYMKLNKAAAEKPLIRAEVTVLSLDKTPSTFKGVRMISFLVQVNKKSPSWFVRLQEDEEPLKEKGRYEIVTYDDNLVSYKEIK